MEVLLYKGLFVTKCSSEFLLNIAPVAQWVQGWPAGITAWVRYLLEAKIFSAVNNGCFAHSLSLSPPIVLI